MAVNGSIVEAATTAAATGFTGEYEVYCDYNSGIKLVATLKIYVNPPKVTIFSVTVTPGLQGQFHQFFEQMYQFEKPFTV